MPIKESIVQTQIQNLHGEFDKVPVVYTDELKQTSVYDLAYSSSIAGYLDYLFIGYFTGENLNKWYFANARRHQEMHEAIQKDVGLKLNYVYGQIWFYPTLKLSNKGLKFNQIALSSDIPEKEKTLKLLLSQIDPQWIHERLEMYATENRGFDKLWSYNYDKSSGSLKKNKLPKT